MTLLYRALLLLYPREFRARYATDILAAIDDRRRAARASGGPALVRFHLRALVDLLANAAGERLGRPGPAGSPAARSSRMMAIGQDVRFAVRMLRRRPALSFFSAATLALGIGSITAVASLVDAVLIRPLPYPRPSEIVAIGGVVDSQPTGISYENLRDIGDGTTSITANSPFIAQSVNLTGVAEPDRLRGGFVTSGFFAVVGVPPAIGRHFGPDVDRPGAAREAVLTDQAWRTRFGGRDMVGESIQLNNAPFTVVGIMPPGFAFPIDEIEVFLPFWTTTAGLARDNHNYFGVARLAAGTSLVAANAEAAAVAAVLERTYPGVNRGRSAAVRPLQDVLTGDLATPLRLLATMVVLMLLAAAANVAGLQLGDSAARGREIAVRSALGAGRLRMLRQLLFESIARAGIGAVAGIGAAAAFIGSLVANAPAGVYGLEYARLGWIPVIVAAVTTLAAGIAAGLPAALQWTSDRGLTGHAGTRVTADPRVSRTRTVLVVCQVAVAAVLLVAAGLTMRSFERLTSVDTGFDASNLLTMEYRLPRNKYASPLAQSQFHHQVVERVEAVPGVAVAASVRALPFSGNGNASTYRLVSGGEARTASINAVSSRYFEALRIPLLAGRGFTASEGEAPVVVVSRALTQRAWPGVDPIGRDVHFDEVGITARVVGVVGDVRHQDLADADEGTIYTHHAQNPSVFNTLVVRTAGPPMALADTVRRAVWSIDPDQPVWKIRTLESLVARSTAARLFLLQLVLFFGISVAALSLLGLYGVVASSVAQRTREIGVRMALGAPRTRVLRLVLWAGLRPGLIGLAVGLAGAAAGAQVLRGVLFGITPRDPVTFAGVTFLLLLATLAACWVPARRALRLDPVHALRGD
jgi:putative ABC transport system permease protein